MKKSSSKKTNEKANASRATPAKPSSMTATNTAQKAVSTGKSGTEAERATGEAASRLIDQRIESLGDWRARTLTEVRRLIHEADPEIVEEWKWMGTPVWSHSGNICTGETYKQVVKLTFARGANLNDPKGLFNSSLEGNTRRAIDLREGESLDATAFKALIKAAVAVNLQTAGAKSRPASKAVAKGKSSPAAKETSTDPGKVKLLTGGNPQIAKADGDAPIQAFIAAMPGWKRDVGRWLDEVIVKSCPNVRKAVKWNSPFYGIEGQGWFANFHCCTKYIKVAFFRGASLRPVPPEESKQQEVRYFHIFQDTSLDEAQLAAWVTQAAAIPGWTP